MNETVISKQAEKRQTNRLRSRLPLRKIALAVLVVITILPAAIVAKAEDDQLSPCNAVASYLRNYADNHPDASTSEQLFPHNALEAPESGAQIGFMRPTDHASLDEVETALAPIKFDQAAREFMESVYLDTTKGWSMIDARSLGDRVVLYQMGGSASCYVPAIFDTSGGVFRPAYSGGVEEGDVCDGFGTMFGVLRVGEFAYPTLSSVPNESVAYQSKIEILPRNGANIGSGMGQCRVEIRFRESLAETVWDLSATEDRNLAERLRELLLPLDTDLRNGKALNVLLKDYLAKPTGPGSSDRFQRLAAWNDPSTQPADLLTHDEAIALVDTLQSGGWTIGGKYLALEMAGMKIIIVAGERELGWRTTGYTSLAAWKWTDQGAVPLLDADFLIRGAKPEIMVFGQ
nr:hypothetical protein [uncultured Dongia sp.]